MSEALQMADELDRLGSQYDSEIAAELRRLCAELERKSDAIQRLWKERDELRTLNAELVEALRCADAMLSGANMDAKAVERKVSAALAKVEASK